MALGRFGCVTGKDRTGLIAGLLLSALGASDDDIVEDYMLSQAAVIHNGSLASKSAAMARAEAEARGEPVGEAMMGSPADPRNQAMASVWPEIMRYQLQVVRAELGGIEGFLDSIGFREPERRQLRALLVDPDP